MMIKMTMMCMYDNIKGDGDDNDNDENNNLFLYII